MVMATVFGNTKKRQSWERDDYSVCSDSIIAKAALTPEP